MQFSGNVLIIEQDHAKRNALETIFTFLGAATQTGEPDDCLSYLDSSSEQVDACILGVLGSTENKDNIPKLLKKYQRTAFIVFDEGFIPTGKENANYIGRLAKEPTYDEVVQLLHYCQAFKSMSRFSGRLDSRRGTLIKRLVGRSDSVAIVRRLIEQVATTDANVLILGESGTGKEVVARAIHDLSARNKRPFVPVNCGAIPGELLESELFGHEKGAFTGAFATREGRFELAEGGTLFLDEIGDMPFQMQVKLLRVLQERTFTRVGSNKIINANVRIIAATHQNLEKMVAENKFREDLFYRLNVFPIETPALRDRIDDIPLLIQELINRHGKEQQATIRFTQRAMLTLMHGQWKGNVRELSNLVERLLILHPNEVVDINDLPGKYRGIEVSNDPVAERDAILEAFTCTEEFENDGSFDIEDMNESFKNLSSTHTVNSSAPNAIGTLPPLDDSTVAALNAAGNVISDINSISDINTNIADGNATDSKVAKIELPEKEVNNIAVVAEEVSQSFTPKLPSNGVNLKDMITDIEISMIKQALEHTNGVVAKAAETLGLRRTTLIEKMKKYGLSAQQQQ